LNDLLSETLIKKHGKANDFWRHKNFKFALIQFE